MHPNDALLRLIRHVVVTPASVLLFWPACFCPIADLLKRANVACATTFRPETGKKLRKIPRLRINFLSLLMVSYMR
ncbi:unnamed protein product [Protopolystoma xenopodis]|uniref:Uncharacterized protein n=1 Tax=Protopolystoma xenopodis TaxID=117903 RepID=A0A3S5ACX9_9PLAT|nr:unnamed protein product [Protopolystoma xenopodis]